jgi:hypothetical protein
VVTRLRPADRVFVETATRHFREALTELVAEHEDAGRDAGRLLGDPKALAARAVQASVPTPSPWDPLIGPFTRSEGVQARLGVSRQAVAASAARRRLLRVVTTDDVHLYPLWQFDGPGLLAGLAPVLALFPEDQLDGWTLAGWLRTADPELGEPPYDVLVRGEHERVLAAARNAAAALAA